MVGRPDGDGGERRPLFLCLSHLRWDFVWQRPQHLLIRTAREFDVVMMEEPVHADEPAPRLDVTSRPHGIRIAVPVLPHGMEPAAAVAAQRRLLDGFLAEEGRRPEILWYYTPMAMAFSGHLEAGLVIYDNMDELSAFRGASPAMLSNEAALFARADAVFTGGMSLYEAKRGRHPNVSAFPSSIDAHHFAAARVPQGDGPADQAGIPHPRIGFFGVADERMDVDLVAGLVRARPDWHFVMIGPVVKIEPASLPRRPNLHWLGPRSYAELPAYLAGWDAGFMPFALNESTRYISPTKTPEFLAAGLPLVSTPIADVISPYGTAGLVEIATGVDAMARAIATVLARPRGPWLEAVDRHLSGCSWDITWAAMREVMSRTRAAGRPGR